VAGLGAVWVGGGVDCLDARFSKCPTRCGSVLAIPS
jgi:hypothetical protein